MPSLRYGETSILVVSEALFTEAPTVLTVATVPDTDTPSPKSHILPATSTEAAHGIAISNKANSLMFMPYHFLS